MQNTNKEMFKGLFVLEFTKCNSSLLKNARGTFVNFNKVFKLKNYFTTLFQFTTSCSIRNNYIFWFKHPLHTIALLQKIIISTNFFVNFCTSQVWRYFKIKIFWWWKNWQKQFLIFKMQNWHRKCIVIWLTLLSNLNIKFNFASNYVVIKNVYHQKICNKSKNIKISF